jgi:hypothetical protein
LVLLALVALALWLVTRLVALRRRTWQSTTHFCALFCLAAFVALGILEAAQVIGFATIPPLPADGLAIASHRTGTPGTKPVVWTEMISEGRLVARSIVGQNVPCPIAEIGGMAEPMQQRFAVAPNAFAVRLCQIRYDGTSRASLAGQALPSRPSDPKRILVLGDSGCRIAWYTNDSEVQACTDSALWPFQRIAETAARLHPDLIVHVGDYHYRESPCPESRLCDDSPFGDTWDAWAADFFVPAAALLRAAPWVMLRGNHEDCNRAGTGWFYFLGLGDWVPRRGCSDSADAYVLHFDGLDVAVLDTAHAEDSHGRKARVDEYKKLFDRVSPQLKPATNNGTWVLVHQPLWSSFGNRDADRNLKEPEEGSPPSSRPLDALRERMADWNQNGVGPKISLVISGDTHLFQFFGARRPEIPVQLVVGTGGDLLETSPKYDSMADPTGEVAKLYDEDGRLWTRKSFGFVLLTRADAKSAWFATFYDTNGIPLANCSLTTRSCA